MKANAATYQYEPFPTAVLPEPVRGWVRQNASAIGCDPEFLALPLLTALASCIGTTRRLRLKRSWAEYPIFWTGIIGESGTTKSPAFRAAVSILTHLQGEALEKHADELEQYETDLETYQLELDAWRKTGHKRGDPKPEAPKEPEACRYIVSDTTIESLAPILLSNPRGLTLARDELSGWLQGFDAYRQGKGGDAAKWLEMHSAGTLVIDRKTGKPRTLYVPRAAVSICGTIQPRILARCFGSEHFDSGLAARFLFAMPPRRIKQWTDRDIDPASEREMLQLHRRLLELQFNRGPDDKPRPLDVELSEAGKRAWVGFHRAHNESQATLTGDLASHWSKLEAYCARFALLIHMIRWAGDDPSLDHDAVDAESVGCAAALVQWFGNETQRIYRVLREDDAQRETRSLVELIRARDGRITVRDLHRAKRRFTKADEARDELLSLASAGFGTLAPESTGNSGGRPQEVFTLHPDYMNPETVQQMLDELSPAGEVLSVLSASTE